MLLIGVLVVQFRTRRYVAGVYWLAVVLISVVGTLSIHAVDTTSREAWYWLTVLFTFALGTAAGDLIAERLSLGYGPTVILFAVLIAVVAGMHYAGILGAVLAFWVAYILTRPLGASIGDYLSADRTEGGMGLGTAATSGLFLAVILGLVVYLSIRKIDVIEARD